MARIDIESSKMNNAVEAKENNKASEGKSDIHNRTVEVTLD